MDPLSITASVLTVASAAIVSIRSLSDTVKSYQNRNKTLRRLHAKLEALATILDSLIQAISADAPILKLLKDPIDRCKEVCGEFEQSMKKFQGKSKTGVLDWTKLEFMRGDINDFIDSIEGYESTITVALGTINLRNSKVPEDVLQKYEEMIKDTAYNLEVHLQNIDEKLADIQGQDTSLPATSIDLQDEKAVTQQCLRICKDASSYIEALATKGATLLQEQPRDTEADAGKDFEAQVLTRQAFNASQATFWGVMDNLGKRLQTMMLDKTPVNEKERLLLQEDLNISKQCLQVCKMASEISHQKIHRIGEAVAEEDSDQVVVTTLADLFDVRKATSKGRSAQLVATLTPDNFDNVVKARYSSRFAAVNGYSVHDEVTTNTPPITSSSASKESTSSGFHKEAQSSGPETRRDRPNPNEMRKRTGDVDNERKTGGVGRD